MPDKIPVVTVDGPSGSGKGTLCKLLAKQLGWHLLDSGAIYRVLALAALHHDVALDNEEALALLAMHLDVEFLPGKQLTRVILEGEEVSKSIRTEEVGNAASQVAAFPRVREALLRRQRGFRNPPGLVADGRDMGTVVFPDAEVKIFLTASAEERAKRRYNQLHEKGFDVKFERLLAEIEERDARDKNRAVAPLVPADDAWVLDSSRLSIDEVLARVFSHIGSKLKTEVNSKVDIN